MSLPITPIRPPASIGSIGLPAAPQAPGPAESFEALFTAAIGKSQQSQSDSETAINRFLNGENEEVHQIALQTQKTELDFDLFMAVRNKVVQAYQEVMKMQM